MPALPALCKEVWAIFLQLHARRPGAGFGPAPLDEARLLAWAQLRGRRLTPWEADCIFDLDDAWLSAQAEETAKTEAKSNSK